MCSPGKTIKTENSNLYLMSVPEAGLDSAYGCGCDNCRVTIRNKGCCYKDCWKLGTWTPMISEHN